MVLGTLKKSSLQNINFNLNFLTLEHLVNFLLKCGTFRQPRM